MSDKDWTAKVKYTLKQLYDIDYEKTIVQTLWGIRIVLFVKPEHSKKITHLQCSQVRTGIGNVAGEQGKKRGKKEWVKEGKEGGKEEEGGEKEVKKCEKEGREGGKGRGEEEKKQKERKKEGGN